MGVGIASAMIQGPVLNDAMRSQLWTSKRDTKTSLSSITARWKFVEFLESPPMQDLDPTVVRCQECGHPTSAPHHTGPGSPFAECDCCTWAKCATGHEEPQQQTVRVPPPTGFSPEKWSAMNRRERRAFGKAAKRGRR